MESTRHPILLLCPLHHDGLCLFKLQAKTVLPLNCLLLGVLSQEWEQKIKQLGNQIFFWDVAGLSLKEGAERKNLSLYPMLANGILGDLSYRGNKNWKKNQKILLFFEEVGIGALQIF